MLHECCQHLKAPAVVEVPFIVEKIFQGSVFYCNTKVAFPYLTSISIQRGREKSIIGLTSRKFRDSKVVLDQIIIVQEGLLIL